MELIDYLTKYYCNTKLSKYYIYVNCFWLPVGGMPDCLSDLFIVYPLLARIKVITSIVSSFPPLCLKYPCSNSSTFVSDNWLGSRLSTTFTCPPQFGL